MTDAGKDVRGRAKDVLLENGIIAADGLLTCAALEDLEAAS